MEFTIALVQIIHEVTFLFTQDKLLLVAWTHKLIVQDLCRNRREKKTEASGDG